MSRVHLTTLSIRAAFCQVLETSWQTGDLATQATQGEGWEFQSYLGERERGGWKKKKKNMWVFFVFWIMVPENSTFSIRKTGWVLTETSSRSVVLHRCLQVTLRVLGIWNKRCDIRYNTQSLTRDFKGCTNQTTLPLVGGFGVWKTSVFVYRALNSVFVSNVLFCLEWQGQSDFYCKCNFELLIICIHNGFSNI